MYCNEDNPNATLFKKKGDIISVKYSHYSTKSKQFQFKNQSEFYQFHESIKNLIMNFFSNHECDILDSFFTRRINYKNYRIELQPYLKTTNEFLRKIDVAVNDLEEALSVNIENPLIENELYMSLCSFIENEVYGKLIVLFEKIDNEDSFNYQELINFVSNNYEIVIDRIKSIETKMFETFD